MFNDDELGAENAAENVEKMNKYFELTKYQTVTERICANDVIFITHLLQAEILYPKSIELLENTIKYHTENEDYEACDPINKVMQRMLELQKLRAQHNKLV